MTGASGPVWRGMDRATVESEYQPSLHVPSLQTYLERYAERSALARAGLPHERIAYGDHADEWLWYAAAPRPGAPLLAFLHGGYWRRLSADDGCLLAPLAHAHGFAFASINYSLCPTEPLATLVEQARRAVGFLTGDGVALGHDPDRVHVAGHSAGAHLAAMAAVADDRPAGLVLVSGVYDVTPIVHTTINDDVRLTVAEAERLSPQRLVGARRRARSVVTWGALETAEFRRQSLAWAAAWDAVPGNVRPVLAPAAGRNHFDVLFDLLDPGTPLGSAVTSQLRA